MAAIMLLRHAGECPNLRAGVSRPCLPAKSTHLLVLPPPPSRRDRESLSQPRNLRFRFVVLSPPHKTMRAAVLLAAVVVVAAAVGCAQATSCGPKCKQRTERMHEVCARVLPVAAAVCVAAPAAAGPGAAGSAGAGGFATRGDGSS